MIYVRSCFHHSIFTTDSVNYALTVTISFYQYVFELNSSQSIFPRRDRNWACSIALRSWYLWLVNLNFTEAGQRRASWWEFHLCRFIFCRVNIWTMHHQKAIINVWWMAFGAEVACNLIRMCDVVSVPMGIVRSNSWTHFTISWFIIHRQTLF